MAKLDSTSELSPAQIEIMNLIWQQGELSTPQIRTLLKQQGREVTRNTVRTLLDRMEQKGWVRHRAEGRTYLYQAVQPQSTTIGRKVREFVDRLCDGRPQLLVNALLDEGNLTDEEISDIRKLLNPKTDSEI